jgi:hypothetical protein
MMSHYARSSANAIQRGRAIPSRAPRFFPMFGFFSSKLGCIGSLIVSAIGTLILVLIMRGCSG